MTLHVLWKLKPGIKAWDEQYAYVKGYILALEDVLGDLVDMSMKPYPTAHIRERVLATLTTANLTLVTLEGMENETTDSPGAHPAPGAPDAEDQGRVPD